MTGHTDHRTDPLSDVVLEPGKARGDARARGSTGTVSVTLIAGTASGNRRAQ